MPGNARGITSTTRSGVWYDYRWIIEATRPRHIITENVPGLLSHGIKDVMQDLAAIGYDAEWEVLGAGDLGASTTGKGVRCCLPLFLTIYVPSHSQEPGQN